MYRTDDPIADFHRYDSEQEEALARLPICDYCGKPIHDEHLWDIEGTLYHEHCAELQFRKETEDYEQ